MATTTNFGWETPDDTDLVKDGALAMRTLGNSIDTSFVDLKGGTTGQVLSKASNTDLDFTWVAQDDSNAIQNAIIDAKGDLIVGTAADTPARLAVGTNGHVLTADSAEASGMKWAAPSGGGGANWTLLNAGGTSLSGATTTISGISAKNQILVLITQVSGSSASARVRVRLNGDTASNYYNIGKSVYFNSTYSASMSEQRTGTLTHVEFGQMANSASSNISGYIWFDGCNSTGVKTYHKQMGIDTGGGSALVFLDGGGYWDNSATVTEVNISMDTGNLDGGTVYIYTSAV